MTHENDTPEERLGRLLHELPPAPHAWVSAASELPRVRRALEHLERDILAGAGARDAATAQLEAALADVELDPTPERVEALRRLAGGD
jgi:hypothetical protein